MTPYKRLDEVTILTAGHSYCASEFILFSLSLTVLPMISAVSVSYTHLDVYKRQVE